MTLLRIEPFVIYTACLYSEYYQPTNDA